ncbi:MAG: DUF4129 domain-containing protein [Firmicutes bacterium]|nr:DUF4129 domain-containing protein [Bacillota bacterium]
MKLKGNLLFNIICYLWLTMLVLGLSVTLQFANRGTILFAVIFFSLVDLVLERVLPGIAVKLLVSLLLIHRTFYVGSFLDQRWLGWLWHDMHQDWLFLQNRGFLQLSPVSSLVMILFLAMVLQSLYFVFLSRRRGALPLLFLGAVLLTFSSMFFRIEIGGYLFVYILLGLVVMATTHIQRNFAIPLERWLSVLVIVALCLTSVAWALPAHEPRLGDLYQELKTRWDEWRDNGEDTEPVRVEIGYGVYDTNLGSPLSTSYSPMLAVTSPVSVYLRGESKDFYTGSGWRSSGRPRFHPEPGANLAPEEIEGEEVLITVSVLDTLPGVVFTPRYPLTVNYDGVDARLQLEGEANPFGDYDLRLTRNLRQGDTYTIYALLPDDDPEHLRTLGMDQAAQRYLQLPSLPERVSELAEEIAGAYDNHYDQIAALVNYLRNNYSYTLDTRQPPSASDFVDDFLFELQEGYCVHFSSALVVMARSLDIPARWVKGFNAGENTGYDYFIMARHAHAWAEVWFDDYGWVPFEPTPGTGSAPEGGAPVGNGNGADNGSETIAPGEPHVPPEPTPPEDPRLPEGEPVETPAGRAPFAIQFDFNLWWLAALTLIGLLAGGIVYQVRRVPRAEKEYARLQGRLALFGWQRWCWETPREHVARVQQSLPGGDALARLVAMLEGAVYGGHNLDRDKFRTLSKEFSHFRLAKNRIRHLVKRH